MQVNAAMQGTPPPPPQQPDAAQQQKAAGPSAGAVAAAEAAMQELLAVRSDCASSALPVCCFTTEHGQHAATPASIVQPADPLRVEARPSCSPADVKN